MTPSLQCVIWIKVIFSVLAWTGADLVRLRSTAVDEGGFVSSNLTGEPLPLIYLPHRFSIITELTLSDHYNQTCAFSVFLPDLLSVNESPNYTVSSNDSNSLEQEIEYSSIYGDRVDVITFHSFNSSATSANYSAEFTLHLVALNPTGIGINDLLRITVKGSWESDNLLSYLPAWMNDSSSWLNDTVEIQFGGPALEVTSPGDYITPNKNVSHSVMMTLPGYWQITDASLTFVFSSEDVSFLDVTLVELLIGPSSPASNITVLSAGPSYMEAEPHSKRSIWNTVTFSWFVGDITNHEPYEAQLQFELIFQIPGIQPLFAGDVINLSTFLDIDDTSVNLQEMEYFISVPDIEMTSVVEVLGFSDQGSSTISGLDTFRITIVVDNRNVSQGAPANNVSLSTQTNQSHIRVSSLVPSVGVEGLEITSNHVKLTETHLQVGEQMTISYVGYFTDEFIQSTTSIATVTSEVRWTLGPSEDSEAFYDSISEEVCLNRVISYEDDTQVILYAHLIWIFALAFVVGLLCFFVCLVGMRQERNKVHSLGDQWGGGLSGTSITYSRWYRSEENFEKMRDTAKNESIVYYLTQKEKKKKHFEFGNLDIVLTVNIDIQLEDLRLNSMMQSFQLLLEKFGRVATPAKDLLQKVYRNASRNMKDVIRDLNNSYREEIREIELKHHQELKTNQLQLRKKNAVIRRRIEKESQHLEGRTKNEILITLDNQQELEIAESKRLLELAQGEECERLRREYDIKKRLAIKRLQQESLDEVITDGDLDDDRARQLRCEYRDISTWLDNHMDGEISQQRMKLEESIAEKKGLAEQNNTQEEWNKKLLNTIAIQTADALAELEKDDHLTEAESKEYLERIKKDVQSVKDKYEITRATQHAALHKRLTRLKKEKLAEKEKEQLGALAKFEDEQHAKLKQNEQDPQVYLESKLTLISSQKGDLMSLSNKLDDKAKEELDKLETELVEKTKQEMVAVKENLCATLMKDKGLTVRTKDELMEQHQRDIERLEEARDEAKRKQETEIENRLTQLRNDLATRKKQEQGDREKIRNYEENMVNKLLASQVAVSQEERNQVLAECENNLIAVEDGLALTKLRQQRLVEEKLAKMRSKKMLKMEKKHETETRRQMRSNQMVGESDSNSDGENTAGELIKRQVAEKLELMNSVTPDVDMDTIREEMLRERALALKRQEEKMGAMMAQLQLAKAREMATIEEQQKALLQLKMNMVDEMTETGVIKNSQANKVIEAHQKSLQNLEKKVNAQREKQEEVLKERLREKMLEREKTMEIRLESELREMGRRVSNSTVLRLKRVALKHKHMKQREQFSERVALNHAHMKQREQFRNKMEVEIAQTLEEVKRQFEIDKSRKLQNQEMEFLSALAKFGGYSESQLRKALTILFPAKSSEEISALMKKMFKEDIGQEEQQSGPPDGKNGPLKLLSGMKKGKKSVSSEADTLEEKVKKTIVAAKEDKPSDTRNRRRSSVVTLLKKGRLTPLVKEEAAEDRDRDAVETSWPLPEISSNERPEPLGRAAQYDEHGHDSPSDDDDDSDGNDSDRSDEAVLL